MSVDRITTAEYRTLAELRYRIRIFLRDGDVIARAAGVEPQQYLMLLAIRGLPPGDVATIGTLAERMALRHHSAVELINRLEKRGYVRRTRGRDDRRRVIVSLLPVGERKVEEVVRNRFDEMHSNVQQLVETLIGLLEQTQHERGGYRRTTRLRQRVQGQRG